MKIIKLLLMLVLAQFANNAFCAEASGASQERKIDKVDKFTILIAASSYCRSHEILSTNKEKIKLVLNVYRTLYNYVSLSVDELYDEFIREHIFNATSLVCDLRSIKPINKEKAKQILRLEAEAVDYTSLSNDELYDEFVKDLIIKSLILSVPKASNLLESIKIRAQEFKCELSEEDIIYIHNEYLKRNRRFLKDLGLLKNTELIRQKTFKSKESDEEKKLRKDAHEDAQKKCAGPNCQKIENLKKCGNCAIPSYCSSACQKGDWKRHKLNCGKYKELFKMEKKIKPEDRDKDSDGKEKDVDGSASASGGGAGAASGSAS